MHLVDANQGQIALTQIKLHLLAHATPAQRLAILGHSALRPEERLAQLRSIFEVLSLSVSLLGPEHLPGELGPDYFGRYEFLFAQLRRQLSKQESMAKLFAATSLAEQVRLTAPDTELGAAIDSAFHQVMSLDNLVALFGADATQNRIQPFADHFFGAYSCDLTDSASGHKSIPGQCFSWAIPPL